MKGDIHHSEQPVRFREAEWPDFRPGDLAWYRLRSSKSGDIVGPFEVVTATDVPERRRRAGPGYVHLKNMQDVHLSLDGSRLTPFALDDPELNAALVAENAGLRALLARLRRAVRDMAVCWADDAEDMAPILAEVDAELAIKGARDVTKQPAGDPGGDPVEPEVPA